ncbi:MAG: stage II sporulation protein D [Clostridia bacterium]|nr:stage II sporulation protein D [Clostridia bacterium]
MKKTTLFPLLCFTVFFFFLWLLAACFGFFGKEYISAPIKESNSKKSALTVPVPKTITLLHQGTVTALSLEEYLYGVVAAEMPASFEEEALKAQAVAARTYTVNRSQTPNPNHPDANVCSESSHCKAYLPPEELSRKFQNEPQLLKKIQTAVDDTKSEIIIYNGEPISAVFHSTSSGMTENAQDVWGNSVPYLLSVVSEGEEASPRYQETKTFTPEEFIEALNRGEKKVSFSESPAEWFGEWIKNDSGSTKSLTICGIPFLGTELRSLLGLRSTHFEISVADIITVTTKGNGHGVGMSQYGANDMAKRGYSYEDILKKYYTGVEIANQ